MFTPRLLGLYLCAFTLLVSPAFAQESKVKTPAAAPVVTASLTQKGVRFAALGAVKQIRVEVLNADGTPLFTSEFHPGSVYDWSPSGDGAQPLADGSYQLVVTIRDAAGRLSIKQCAIAVRGGEVALELGEADKADNAVAEDAPVAVKTAEPPAMTLTAHDGQVGQVVSTTGALSFRLGNFFAGRDKEAMRLNESGLSVTGLISASGGIKFSDDTVLTSTGSAARLKSDGTVTPAATGVGAQNRVAKWTDNAGTLGDSSIFDNGSVGVGTTAPVAKLDVRGGSVFGAGTPTQYAGNQHTVEITGSGGFTPLAIIGGTGTVELWKDAQPSQAAMFGAGAPGQPADGNIHFATYNGQSGWSDRFVIQNSSGNVGIGTPSPASKLDVAGGGTFSGNLAVHTNALFVNSTNSRVGIGTAAPQASLHIQGTVPNITYTTIINDALFVDAPNNRVGIGTASPQASLHVQGVEGYVPDGGAANGANAPTALKVVGGTGNQNGFGVAGTGGNIILQGGNGGQPTNVTNYPAGNGGSITLQPGNSGGTGGSAGSVLLAPTAGRVGVGTSSPAATLHVVGTTALVGNVGVGTVSPQQALSVVGGLVVDQGNVNSTAPGAGPYSGITFGSDNGNTSGEAISSRRGGQTNAFGLDFYTDFLPRLSVTNNGLVGIGTTSPSATLDVNGPVRVGTLGLAGSTVLCLNSSGLIAGCSSSLRYKKNVAGLASGLDLVNRLRPVTFNWKQDGTPDLGLVAEEVAKVAPLLVTHNSKGEIEGVKYEHLPVVLINAVKEQQQQIEELRRQNARLSARLSALDRRPRRAARRR
jgi:hypothetical protein